VHRVSDLAPIDLRQRPPFQLTSPERTLVDIAGRLRERQLEAILDEAARDGLLSVDSVTGALARLRRSGRAGVARLDRVLGHPTVRLRADSWLERQLLKLIEAAGLPLPRTQVVLERCDEGVARVDALFDDAKLIIEVDGHHTHSTRRQRQADAQREAALLARGWRVVRFTYEDVTERPAYVVHTIRLLLAA
jgi:very-short-patch-repair endonuclease